MSIFNIADCLATTIDGTTFSILAQAGSASSGGPNGGSSEVYSNNNELWGPPGLLSLPAGLPQLPAPVAPQMIYLERGTQNIVVGHKDVRFQSIIGNLNPGETYLFGGGATGTAQGSVAIKQDGTINLTTTDTNTASGNSIQMTLGPTGFFLIMPFGKMSFDVNGFRVALSSGATFNMLNSQDPTTGNSIMLTAGAVTLNSGLITLGNPVNTAVPLGVAYGILPPVAPGVPIFGEGVGLVTVAASVSTSVFVGI